jgi:hypothetical protein
VVDAERALQRNDKVQRLEDACEWYRREALRLDALNTAMRKDLKRMGDKVAVLGAYMRYAVWYEKKKRGRRAGGDLAPNLAVRAYKLKCCVCVSGHSSARGFAA